MYFCYAFSYRVTFDAKGSQMQGGTAIYIRRLPLLQAEDGTRLFPVGFYILMFHQYLISVDGLPPTRVDDCHIFPTEPIGYMYSLSKRYRSS